MDTSNIQIIGHPTHKQSCPKFGQRKCLKSEYIYSSPYHKNLKHYISRYNDIAKKILTDAIIKFEHFVFYQKDFKNDR